MGHVVDPAAFAYWKGSGTEETAKGDQGARRRPRRGWEALESAAAALIEAGNELQLPGRPRKVPKYAQEALDKYAQKLSQWRWSPRRRPRNTTTTGSMCGRRSLCDMHPCHEEYVIEPMLRAGGRRGHPLPDWPADIKAKQEALERSH